MTATTTAPAPRTLAAPPAADGVRRDIQVLRAVAVAAVVVFHLWPGFLPGGYVGVDVFFVVSGYLITSHLLRTPPTSLRGLAEFWGRRVRRLLPAAATVLAVTAVASVVLLPTNLLKQAAREIVASALLVENWTLARQATDYLAADATPTPVQHFWSLGVEEQFYLFWPLLIAGAVLLAGWAGRRFGPLSIRARGAAVGPRVGPLGGRGGGTAGRAAGGTGAGRRLLVGSAIALALVASLAWSIHLTAADPARAYFVTPTRVWELALGALLAVVGARTAGWVTARTLAGWAGLAAIVVACVAFGAATPFPGYTALLPTLGAVAVVWSATDDTPGGPGRVLGRRPVVWVGDVSYGVYLWHWPLLILAPFAVGAILGGWARAALVVLTLALAAGTRRWIEDPIRHSRTLRASLPRTFAIGAAVTACTLGLAVTASAVSDARVEASREAVVDPTCLGAAAVRDPSCGDPTGTRVLTEAGLAAVDRSELYEDGCWNNAPFTGRRTCTYGSSAPTRDVVLLGNSHAGQWQPVLAPLAEESGWALTTYLTSECYPVDLPIDVTVPANTRNCTNWTDWAIDSAAAQRPDLVVLAARTFRPLQGVAPGDQAQVAQESYARTLSRFTEAGIPVLVMRDTFAAPESVPDCVARERGGWRSCTWPQDVAVEADPLASAAEADRSGLVSVLDVTDTFCWDGRCHGVVGGAVVYFDHGHLTTTFARTLMPEVAAAVRERIGA